MSGAGWFPAGAGGAGFGTPDESSSPRTVTPPWALFLDPATRDFPVDEDGQYVSAHPIDHQAMMRLIPAKGTIASAQAQGGPWKGLEIADAATMTRRMREYVSAAWRDLIANGDVRIVDVRMRPSNSIGRARLDLVWMNLRDPADARRTTPL